MNEPSSFEQDTRMLVDKLEKRLNGNLERMWEEFKEVRKEIKELQDKFINRLPLWTTVVISLLVGFIGWLIKGKF